MNTENPIKTDSDIEIFKNYKDNICCIDTNNKALTDKAESKRERYTKGKAKGLSRLGSKSSEDALTWSVFRTLEIENKMDIFYHLINIDDILEKTVFWTRDTKTGNVDLLLQTVLDEIEPKNLWKIQQTEPDIILVGRKTVVFNESKLGHPNTKVLGWSRSKNFEDKHKRYMNYIGTIFTDYFQENFQDLGVKFYQLMRNIIIGKFYADKLGKEFHLSVVVNELNTPNDDLSHKDKFDKFSTYLKNKDRIHFTTWQNIYKAINGDSELIQLNEYLKHNTCLKRNI